MKINNQEIDLNKIIGNIDLEKNKFNKINNLMLTNEETFILDKYKINYENCGTLKDIMILVENLINNEEIENDEYDELDYLMEKLSERDYYENINK